MPNQKSDELMISARAKDIHDACGEWGHLHVAISKYDQIIINRIKFRFENYIIMNLIEKYFYKIIII